MPIENLVVTDPVMIRVRGDRLAIEACRQRLIRGEPCGRIAAQDVDARLVIECGYANVAAWVARMKCRIRAWVARRRGVGSEHQIAALHHGGRLGDIAGRRLIQLG